MNEDRLSALEFKISHQEVLLEELNQVVITQQETIDKMEKALKSMLKRLYDANVEGLEIGPGDQKPPHY